MTIQFSEKKTTFYEKSIFWEFATRFQQITSIHHQTITHTGK